MSVREELNLLPFLSTNNSEAESTRIKRLNVKDMGQALMKTLALQMLCKGHSRYQFCLWKS